MATRGYIQIGTMSVEGDKLAKLTRIQATHDGYLDEMFKDVFQGLRHLFIEYYAQRPDGHARLLREVTIKSRGIDELMGYFMSAIPFDTPEVLIMAGLIYGNPMQYEVEEVNQDMPGFRADYGGWIIHVDNRRLPTLTIQNNAVGLSDAYEENPRWLHLLLRELCSLKAHRVTYKDGVVTITLNIYRMMAEWFWKEFKIS